MSPSPQLRSLPDRIRQVALFELGGLLLITPPFIWLSGMHAGESLLLLALVALLAALWNAAYNTGFDWLEGRPWPDGASRPLAETDGPGFRQLGWKVSTGRLADGLLVAERRLPEPALTVRIRLDTPS